MNKHVALAYHLWISDQNVLTVKPNSSVRQFIAHGLNQTVRSCQKYVEY